MDPSQTVTKNSTRVSGWHAVPEEHRIAVLSCVMLLLLGVLSCLTFVNASDMSVGFAVNNGESSSSSSSESSSSSSSSAASAGSSSSSASLETSVSSIPHGGNSRRSEEILKTLTEKDAAFIVDNKHLPNCEYIFQERFGLKPEDSAVLCEENEAPLHTAPSEEVLSSSATSTSSSSSKKDAITDPFISSVVSSKPPSSLCLTESIKEDTLCPIVLTNESALHKKMYYLFSIILLLTTSMVIWCVGTAFTFLASRLLKHKRYLTPIVLYDKESLVAKKVVS